MAANNPLDLVTDDPQTVNPDADASTTASKCAAAGPSVGVVSGLDHDKRDAPTSRKDHRFTGAAVAPKPAGAAKPIRKKKRRLPSAVYYSPHLSGDSTLEGHGPLGDSERCRMCGSWKEYAGDGVFLCMDCC